MDVRDNFVNLNKWMDRGLKPCPKCGIHSYKKPPPKFPPNRYPKVGKPITSSLNMKGCMRVIGIRESTGKTIWACYDCNFEQDL